MFGECRFMSDDKAEYPPLDDLDACYAYCRDVAHKRGPNFSVGFRFLPAERRRAVYAAYAFCRFADDIADEVGKDNPERLLGEWEQALERCYRGETDHPVLVALADAAERFSIPADPFHRLIEGCRMDLTISRYETFEDLLVYCDRVATTISEMSLAILERTDPQSQQYGRDLSTALQLTNIARDVAEDWERQRVYVPQEELRQFNCPESDFGKTEPTEEFRALMYFQIERIMKYYDLARPLVEVVEPDTRVAVALMGDVYKRIAVRIGEDVGAVLRGRVGMTPSEKVRVGMANQLRQWFRWTKIVTPPGW